MLSRVFPKVADNNYRGHWLAIVLFVAVILMKGAQGLLSMVNPADTMVRADGIPLDAFGTGTETAVRMFALLGMYILILSLIGAVTLIRWRTLIPFMFVVLIVAQGGARVIGALHLVVQTASAGSFAGQPYGFWINIGLLGLTVVGFLLSLMNRARSQEGTQ